MPVKHDNKFFDTRLEAVEYAISQMDWLTPADSAQVDICRATAEQIDKMLADEDANIRKAGAYLLRELKSAIAALGGSPESRKELGAKPDEDEDPDEKAVKEMQEKARGNVKK